MPLEIPITKNEPPASVHCLTVQATGRMQRRSIGPGDLNSTVSLATAAATLDA
jgi:hypothetical protein